VPPENNTRLTIPAYSTVEGTLIFFGAVPDSGEMSVIFNEGRAETSAPSLEIALPPEVVAAAGSKKK
jgi:hypothetical protein